MNFKITVSAHERYEIMKDVIPRQQFPIPLQASINSLIIAREDVKAFRKDVTAKLRIDSIYRALLNGADFAQLAKKYSDDKESAANGGELPWLQYGQTFPEFEKQQR